jgi:hypothetical protein
MGNQEEKHESKENAEQSTPGNKQTQHVGNESTQSDPSHKEDPVHNTGNEHMMIDEEGAEVKPDDQV